MPTTEDTLHIGNGGAVWTCDRSGGLLVATSHRYLGYTEAIRNGI